MSNLITPTKEPSASSIESYANLFKRNQAKFIRRSKLLPEHLGTEFEFDNKQLTLVGSVDSVLMLVKDSSGQYYRMHCDPITIAILGKK